MVSGQGAVTIRSVTVLCGRIFRNTSSHPSTMGCARAATMRSRILKHELLVQEIAHGLLWCVSGSKRFPPEADVLRLEDTRLEMSPGGLSPYGHQNWCFLPRVLLCSTLWLSCTTCGHADKLYCALVASRRTRQEESGRRTWLILVDLACLGPKSPVDDILYMERKI